MKRFKIMSTLIAVSMSIMLLSGCSEKGKVEESNTAAGTTTASAEKDGQGSSDAAYKASLKQYGIVDNGDSITFVDGRDKEVTIKKNPAKAVCAYNSHLDLWYKLGGTVIGRVEASDEKPVPGSEGATVIGKPGSPSAEAIVALQPDLVLLSNALSAHVELAGTLEESGIPVICMEIHNKDDYMKLVRIYSAILGREDSYKKYATDIQGEIDTLLTAVPKGEKPKVMLMMATAKGIKIKNSDSVTGEIFKDLNAEIIGDGMLKGESSADFSMEALLAEDPDFIFVTEMGADSEKIKAKRTEDLENNEVWSSLRAVKDGNYIILPKDLFTYKPNDRYVEAYKMILQHLYPEAAAK